VTVNDPAATFNFRQLGASVHLVGPLRADCGRPVSQNAPLIFLPGTMLESAPARGSITRTNGANDFTGP